MRTVKAPRAFQRFIGLALSRIEGIRAVCPGEARIRPLRKNLFAAPGRIRVGRCTIALDLAPAAKPVEQIAFQQLLQQVNRHNLTLQGDPQRRRLRFRSQIE
jgi:hypothetical protein